MTETESLTERNKIYHGHALEILRTFNSETIDMTITSPPYWGLRDYGAKWEGGDPKCNHYRSNKTNDGCDTGQKNVEGGIGDSIYKDVCKSCGAKRVSGEIWDSTPGCDHEFTEAEKVHESSQPTKWPTSDPEIWSGGTSRYCKKCGAWNGSLGLEPDYNLYIEHLCQIFDEVKRVLKPSGSLWVNIGDTYSGAPVSGKQGGFQGKYSRDINDISGVKKPKTDIQEKSLIGIPFRFALQMMDRGWVLRNTIIWYKPNCMPHSVKDRFTVDFEYVFFFTKQTRYYFEQQFEPYECPLDRWGGIYTDGNTPNSKYFDVDLNPAEISMRSRSLRPNGLGRNKRTVWPINTKPFLDAHFAVYPEELVETPIKAACPKEICRICGKPKERKFKSGEIVQSGGAVKWDEVVDRNEKRDKMIQREVLPDGWTDCGCGSTYIPGIVLDPFMGSGTTGAVAKKLGRNWVGIEQNEKYIQIALNRISKAYEQSSLFE